MNTEEIERLCFDRRSIRLVYDKQTLEILGDFKTWREQNPSTSLGSFSDFSTVTLGDSLSQSNDKDLRKKLGLDNIHNNMIENYTKKQEMRYKEACKIAKPILDDIETELNQLMAKYNFSIDYFIDGDTHGIHEEYQYISVEVNGFHIEREI